MLVKYGEAVCGINAIQQRLQVVDVCQIGLVAGGEQHMINNETLTIRELDVDLAGGQFMAGSRRWCLGGDVRRARGDVGLATVRASAGPRPRIAGRWLDALRMGVGETSLECGWCW